MYPGNPFLEFSEPATIKWHINSIVHPVTGKHKIRFGLGQYTLESFMKVRPRKSPTGMTWFGKAGNGLAGQSYINEFYRTSREVCNKIGFYICNIIAGISNTVAEKNNSFHSWKYVLCIRKHGLKRY